MPDWSCTCIEQRRSGVGQCVTVDEDGQGLQPGLDTLQSAPIVAKSVRQPDVREQLHLLVGRHVVHLKAAKTFFALENSF